MNTEEYVKDGKLVRPGRGEAAPEVDEKAEEGNKKAKSSKNADTKTDE